MAYGKIVADQIEHSSEGTVDTQYVVNGSAKAYAVTGHSSGTPQTTKLFNVSSLTDNAVGRMSVNFTSNFDSVNYTRVGTANVNETITYYCIVADDHRASAPYVVSTSTAPMASIRMNNAFDDSILLHFVFHGDLA